MIRLSALARSRVAGSTAWSISAVAVSAVTGIFTARALGPAERGTLALVVTIAGFCVLIGALGTNVSVRRHLPRKESVNRAGYRQLSAFLVVPLIIVLLAALYIVASAVDPSFGDVWIGFAFIAYGIAYFFSNQALDLLNALGDTRTSAMVNALGSAVCMVLVGLLALFVPQLVLVIWAYTVSVIAQAVLAQVLIKRKHGRDTEAPRGRRVLLRDGSRLLGLNVGQQLAYQADTILLGALSTRYQVGVYAVAVTPAAILRIPATMLGQVLFHDVAAGAIDRRGVLKRIAALFGFVLPAAVIGWFIGGWLIVVLFGQDYAASVEPFRVLLVAEIALSPFLVLGRVLPGMGRTWGASVCGLAGAAAIIIAGALLIPGLGATGSAWASVIAYGTMSVLAAILFARTKTADV